MSAAHKLPDLRLVVGGSVHASQPATPPSPAVEPRAKVLGNERHRGKPLTLREIERRAQAEKSKALASQLGFSQRQIGRGLDADKKVVTVAFAGRGFHDSDYVLMAKRGCKRFARARLLELLAEVEAA